jgi:hypothetical protein
MAALGRKGGLIGGPARARALTRARRSAIARNAARARWSRPVLPVEARPDLVALVAHGGSSVARVRLPLRLESQVLGAIQASHRDSALARMLPVFLWRMRHRLDPAVLVALARRRKEAQALGFFMETAARLGRTRVFDDALSSLRGSATIARHAYFFHGTERRPFEREAAERASPRVARRWGLLMNMPWESFAAYFDKAARL